MPNKIRNIIIYAIFACSCMYIIEQYSGVSYFFKTLMKICVFEGGILVLKYRERGTKKSKKTPLTYRRLQLSILLSICVFILILIAYALLGHLIDSERILSSLAEQNITLTTLGIIFTYITFGNSFLEESFFRGYVFLGLRDWNKKIAYLFSAGLFSLYHVGIFIDWFSSIIVLLILFGLFIGGLLFAWIADRSDSFVGSWIFHIWADIAIVLIGLRMFGAI